MSCVEFGYGHGRLIVDNCERVHIADVTCDGNPVVANRVVLRHADGFETLYWHLKEGSVAVRVGQRVVCGEGLGLVGSSGYSTVPHLHFEVSDADGVRVDPFAGPRSQPESLWSVQDAGDGLPGDRCPASR